MGPNNKAILGTHVKYKEMEPLKMGKERKQHGKNPPPKRGKPSEELKKPPTRGMSPKNRNKE